MYSQLTTSQSKKKLTDYHTIVSKKKRLKDENQRRRSSNLLPPVSSARKPLKPSNLNTTVQTPARLNTTVQTPARLNTTVTLSSGEKRTRPALDTTVTIKTKTRKPSLELASSAPWCSDTRPRHHDDPVTAVLSLNTSLGISM